ncbi:MAG TPA: glycoside hydrolase, partial [Thermoanaerobaculia bacterium]|nr:glycoside hydrolase [Thermoanaerobaculia bacterium]
LRLNMPATSIRDLIVHDDDVAIATHGRGFWILDDIEPLRQLGGALNDVHLFKPQRAWRYRSNKNTDTPLPPDEPAAQNPPDGAIIDYSLASRANDVVTLEIVDAAGNVVRRFASDDKPYEVKDENNVPWYWIRPPQILSGDAGMHRFVWDLHYTPLARSRPTFSIAATPHDTPPATFSPYVMPGTYSVRLTANGATMTQPLTVRMDPRVKTSTADLQQQFDLSMRIYTMLNRIGDVEEAAPLRQLLETLQEVDAAPTTQLIEAAETLLKK